MAILVFSPNGAYVAKLTLEAARTSADCVGKTVVVTSALTAAQSDITAAWPTDRTLRVEKGGSIPQTWAAGITTNDSSCISYFPAGTGAVAITVQTKIRERVSVRDFGAKGDGVADDTAAIQAAVNYVFLKPKVGTLNQMGGIVWFPAGRYRITSTITSITDGITIAGEPSGLDSVPLTQPGSGSMIFCDNTVTGFPMFTVSDGGPITIQDIGLNGTQTVTNSTCILSGNGVANTGITQAHFSNVRFTGFSTVFKGAKLADVSFYDCGFEMNTTCFNLIGGTYTSLNGIKFVSCIFFATASSVFSLSAAAVLDNVVFSACIFQCDASQVVNCDIFKVYDATLSNISFSACNFIGYTNGNDNLISALSATSAVQHITFSACNFKLISILSLSYLTPVGAMYNVIVNGCILKDSKISAAYELAYLTFTGNICTGTTTIALSACNNLVIASNNFGGCSANPPIVLTDVFSYVVISNNIFNSAVTSIPLNTTSTYVKMRGNVNIADV